MNINHTVLRARYIYVCAQEENECQRKTALGGIEKLCGVQYVTVAFILQAVMLSMNSKKYPFQKKKNCYISETSKKY